LTLTPAIFIASIQTKLILSRDEKKQTILIV